MPASKLQRTRTSQRDQGLSGERWATLELPEFKTSTGALDVRPRFHMRTASADSHSLVPHMRFHSTIRRQCTIPMPCSAYQRNPLCLFGTSKLFAIQEGRILGPTYINMDKIYNVLLADTKLNASKIMRRNATVARTTLQ